MIHNIVMDVLRGRTSPPGVMIAERLDRRRFASLIQSAEVFDFGELHLEDTGERIHGDTVWKAPVLSDEEEAFWDDGYIPIPANPTWLEFTLSGHGSGLLVFEGGEALNVMRFDLDPSPMTGVFIGVCLRLSRGNIISANYAFSSDKILRWHTGTPREQAAEYANAQLAKYLILMINSRSTERERIVQPPDAPRPPGNRHRLPDHTIVRIIPAETQRQMRAESGGGTHASPRLHWRRSHLREYRAPSGEVYHRVVVPRCLVGLAGSDTLTHTYKVKL